MTNPRPYYTLKTRAWDTPPRSNGTGQVSHQLQSWLKNGGRVDASYRTWSDVTNFGPRRLSTLFPGSSTRGSTRAGPLHQTWSEALFAVVKRHGQGFPRRRSKRSAPILPVRYGSDSTKCRGMTVRWERPSRGAAILSLPDKEPQLDHVYW